MKCTATQLRNDIYRILDHVIATGESVEIERGGKRLRIVVDQPARKPFQWVKRDGMINGDSEDLVHIDWSAEWEPDL